MESYQNKLVESYSSGVGIGWAELQLKNPLTIEANQTYFIIVSSTKGSDGNSYELVDDSQGTYECGYNLHSQNSGNNWTTRFATDLNFRLNL